MASKNSPLRERSGSSLPSGATAKASRDTRSSDIIRQYYNDPKTGLFSVGKLHGLIKKKHPQIKLKDAPQMVKAIKKQNIEKLHKQLDNDPKNIRPEGEKRIRKVSSKLKDYIT